MKQIIILALILLSITVCVNSLGSTSHESSSTAAVNTSSEATNATGCAKYTSCSDCAAENHCVWCEGDSICSDGTFYGSKPLSTCKDFRWRQCKIEGRYTLIIAAGIIAVILFFFFCICCCCCCRRRDSHEHKYYSIQNSEDENSHLISKTPKTDARREELYRKWGIKSKNTSY
ncbi:hypothetical protein DLAC_08072 [Tieghemostelium lacteum]|uniref:PSI domain-containing protein n=1 Tax=Tieghemostelium lacteum TaxID=361077 RepID=A0A151ZB37_TIELA|nr:hypothetical protein DLAC_08072 [Tieghemostelium lacteum]|eukprot:KYQ91160.1 hypothetical protein DLAC_08072 [Tieghemostelium lacteum]